eukprot:1153756-Pelagomonas_calceolata.AAC.6
MVAWAVRHLCGQKFTGTGMRLQLHVCIEGTKRCVLNRERPGGMASVNTCNLEGWVPEPHLILLHKTRKLRRQRKLSLHQLRNRRHIGSEET